mmetsp:Transcript_4070/g.15726  ORF Transcript_4070/g.15726 Transcript_4070/m.15726 type:complete len:84 (+) Transcript_4070:194-445(+)
MSYRMSGKVGASGVVVALVCVVGYNSVYLPFYSPLAQERREKLRQSAGAAKEKAGMDKGSMWAEVDAAIKAKRKAKEAAAKAE